MFGKQSSDTGIRCGQSENANSIIAGDKKFFIRHYIEVRSGIHISLSRVYLREGDWLDYSLHTVLTVKKELG
jgi:hypothetical protein